MQDMTRVSGLGADQWCQNVAVLICVAGRDYKRGPHCALEQSREKTSPPLIWRSCWGVIELKFETVDLFRVKLRVKRWLVFFILYLLLLFKTSFN